MKNFFSIIENHYLFEIWDITSIITIANVILVIAGLRWAPLLGIVNCCICLVLNIKQKAHINAYCTQLALIILNIYFLTL